MAEPSRRPLYGFITAYLVSGVGTAMSAVAIPWLVLVTTGSAASTGIVGFAQMAPYVVLQATAGPLVDRFGLRRSFVTGNLAAAAVMCTVPLLHAADVLSLGLLAALVMVAGAVRGVADCATNPLVPVTAAAGDVPNERAIAMFTGANRGAMLAGMPAAGVLIAAIGPASVVLLDGISFAAAVVILVASVPASLAATRNEGSAGSLRGYAADLTEGFRFLGADRLLLGIVVLVAVTNLLDEALSSVLLPVWAHDRVHRAEALGLVGGVLGLGMLAGVGFTAWLGPRLPRRRTFMVGLIVSAAPPFYALAGWTAVPPVLLVCLVCGVAGGVLNPIIGAVEFERIPARLQARVLGAIKASAWLGIPFGALLGGSLTQHYGLTAALLACGSVMLAATLAPLVFPAWRGIDRRQTDVVRASPDEAPETRGQVGEEAAANPR
jgi:MFS family permease